MKFKKRIKQIFISLAGTTIISFGILLLVLPGPGWLIIIIGLTVLASEFAWAEHLLHSTKRYTKQKTQRILRKNRSSAVDKHHGEDYKMFDNNTK